MCSFMLNRLFYGFWIDATEIKMLGDEMENLAITKFLNSVGLNKSCHDRWRELCEVLGFMRKPWHVRVTDIDKSATEKN